MKSAIQVDGMDADLRAGLWNVYAPVFVETLSSSYTAARDEALKVMRTTWDEHFKVPTDSAPTWGDEASKSLRPLFLEGDYIEVYDLIDFTVRSFGRRLNGLDAAYNKVLEREVSGYRFVGGLLCPVSDEHEIRAIEEGLAVAGSLSGAATHLQTALKHMSDRGRPDYRNSVKESISAVESAARVITGKPKATLGDLLPQLEQSGHIHPAQKEAFSKLYGYTSDEEGIRHAMLDDSGLDFADAKYMLAVCAAFIAYAAARR